MDVAVLRRFRSCFDYDLCTGGPCDPWASEVENVGWRMAIVVAAGNDGGAGPTTSARLVLRHQASGRVRPAGTRFPPV
jgi:hypothetical protein